MRTIKTYFKEAPFYNAFIGAWPVHVVSNGACSGGVVPEFC